MHTGTAPGIDESGLFAGAGEMCRRMREYDWERSPLGAPSGWPQSLKTAIRILLTSRQPMFVWWGRDLINLYNDAYRPALGSKHPAALGQPASRIWAEIWDQVGPRAQTALSGTEGTFDEALPLILERNGYPEETYYTFSYSPLPDDAGATAGIFCANTEETARIVGERQLALLRELAAGVARSCAEACAASLRSLQARAQDFPFALLYRFDASRQLLLLEGCAGIGRGHPAVPEQAAVDADDASPWPFAQAWRARALQQVDGLPQRFGAPLPTGAWPLPPQRAVVVPLAAAAGAQAGVLVLALNPYRLFDDRFRGFVDLVASQIAANLRSAQAYEDERDQTLRSETEKLSAMARELSSELNLDALLQKVVDAATALAGAGFGAFVYHSVNERGESWPVYALCGIRRAEFERLGLHRTALFERTLPGKAAVRLDDLAENPREAAVPAADTLRSYLAVPVLSRTGAALGGLFFGHAARGVFSADSERAVGSIAAQAAVALDNAQLYEQAKLTIDRSIRAEGAWRESERRYRQLVHGLPAAVYTTDADGRIELFNEAAVVLWGRKPEVNKEFWCGSERMYDLQGRRLALPDSPMAHALRGEPLGPQEIVIERPGGVRRHVIAHPQVTRDGSGEIVGAVNMLVDITERKHAEAELAATKDDLAQQVEALAAMHELASRLARPQDRRSALQTILETLVDIHGADFGLVSIYDRSSGKLVEGASYGFSADILARITGFEPAAGMGACGDCYSRAARTVGEDTDTDPCFASFREQARAAGFRAVHGTPIITRSGQILGVISVHFRDCRRPTGREMQLADMCARHAADALETLRTEQELRRSERLYGAIGESIDYGVWICDPAGRHTYASESYLRLLGQTQEEYSAGGWSAALHRDEADATVAAWQDCVRSGEPWDRELLVRGADGLWHPILSRGVPVRGENGAIDGWAGINLDIGRLKKVERELRETDQRKNEFLAVLAHELRNPLAPIRNGLEVMRMAGTDAQLMGQIREMMERQLRHMVRLIDDLLDLSRITQGKIELRKQRVDLSSVLQSAIETSRPYIEQAGHVLTVSGPAGPVYVEADITRLSQVFANLLNNAAKYTKEGGRLWVTVTRLGAKVFVSVKDNGIGIPAHMLPQVFEMFTQVDRSLERSQTGLGIGLAISRRLVEMHGGIIEVRSDGYGKGSEFLVRLPAVLPEAVEPAPPEKRDSGPQAPGRRVLVVDDNADSAASMAIICEVMGNEVRTARDGLQAIEVAEVFRPQVILMDIGMPKLNGYEACRRIREQAWGRDMNIIALTGWGQDEDRRRSQAAGFSRHLVKPVSFETIKQLLNELPGGTQPANAGLARGID